MLSLVDLSHAYGRKAVFKGISFELAPSRIGCLFGPSGCGKTTALRLIAGFEQLDRSTIQLIGSCLVYGDGAPVEVLIRPDDIQHDDASPLLAEVERRAFRGVEERSSARLCG